MFLARIRRLLPSKYLVVTFAVMNTLLVMLHVKMDQVHNLHPMEVELIGNQTTSMENIADIEIITPSYIAGDNGDNETGLAPPSFPTMAGFRYIVEPTVDCTASSTVILYIHSHPTHYAARALIRETWGDLTRYVSSTEYSLQLFFVFGAISDLPEEAWTEVKHNEDLLIGDYVDSSENQTLKGLSVLNWINNKCEMNNLKFVLKIDESVFVNLYRIMKRVRTILQTNNTHFLCSLDLDVAIERDGPLQVSPDVISGTYYPPHCNSRAYGMTQAALSLILDSCSSATPHPPLPENYFLTSHCMTATNPRLEIKYKKINSASLDLPNVHLSKPQLRQLSELTLLYPLPGAYWTQMMDIIEQE